MRKVKKVILLLLTLLIGMSNFNVQIFAEDGTIPKEEPFYSATYEFVVDEEGKLPKTKRRFKNVQKEKCRHRKFL